jgi:hypothetical protein
MIANVRPLSSPLTQTTTPTNAADISTCGNAQCACNNCGCTCVWVRAG